MSRRTLPAHATPAQHLALALQEQALALAADAQALQSSLAADSVRPQFQHSDKLCIFSRLDAYPRYFAWILHESSALWYCYELSPQPSRRNGINQLVDCSSRVPYSPTLTRIALHTCPIAVRQAIARHRRDLSRADWSTMDELFPGLDGMAARSRHAQKLKLAHALLHEADRLLAQAAKLQPEHAPTRDLAAAVHALLDQHASLLDSCNHANKPKRSGETN